VNRPHSVNRSLLYMYSEKSNQTAPPIPPSRALRMAIQGNSTPTGRRGNGGRKKRHRARRRRRKRKTAKRPDAAVAGEHSEEEQRLYHQRQRLQLCALHTVNNLVGLLRGSSRVYSSGALLPCHIGRT
jgi:hypothetical protein